MLTMKDDFKILTFVSFCKQCFLVFIRKRHQQNGQGAGNKQEYESPVPACHFGYITENHIGKDGGSEEVPEEPGPAAVPAAFLGARSSA